MLPALEVAAISYLIGSLPFSFLVARAFGVADVRRVGSGNVGATNVTRSAGRSAGLLAFLLDTGKGAAVVALVGVLFPGQPRLRALAALVAVVGHMYPVWLRFEGGKGVATGLGAFATLAPRAAAVAVAAFALGAAGSRTVAIGSIAGALALAVAMTAWQGGEPAAWAAAATAALVVLRHRENLRRLLGGPPGGAGGREA